MRVYMQCLGILTKKLPTYAIEKFTNVALALQKSLYMSCMARDIIDLLYLLQ